MIRIRKTIFSLGVVGNFNETRLKPHILAVHTVKYFIKYYKIVDRVNGTL